MIVSGGKTLLGHQGASKKAQAQNNDADNFQDFLVGAKKKQSQLKSSSKKTYGLKRKKDQEAYDENQQVAKKQERPVKKKDADRSGRVQAQKSDGQSKATESQQKQDSKVNNINDKKFAEVSEKSQQPADSLNLSGIENKSLEKNQKLAESMETKFQQMMTEMKSKQVMGGEQKFGQAMQAKIGSGLGSEAGKIKIGSELKMAGFISMILRLHWEK